MLSRLSSWGGAGSCSRNRGCGGPGPEPSAPRRWLGWSWLDGVVVGVRLVGQEVIDRVAAPVPGSFRMARMPVARECSTPVSPERNSPTSPAVGLHDGVHVVPLQVAQVIIHALLGGLALVDVTPHAINELLAPGANARHGRRAVIVNRLEAMERSLSPAAARGGSPAARRSPPGSAGHRGAGRDVLAVEQQLRAERRPGRCGCWT